MSTLQIGFFGLRNAGKTVGSTVLYHTESGDGLDVTVRDVETIKYLRPLAEALEKGDVPNPTLGDPRYLKWRVAVADKSYDLETTDFPGELLEAIGQEGDPVGEGALAEVREQVRKWFVHCDAILLFVDSTQEGTIRYRDALVRLLDEMSRRPTLRGSAQRAVGVVFTKGDRIASSPDLLGDEEAVTELLAGHPLYQMVQRRLHEHRDNLKSQVFLSSALGWNFLPIPDKNKARRKVEPCKWFAAVRWSIEQATVLVEQTHKQVLDELEQVIAEKKRDEKRSLLTNYRRVLRWLDDADRDFKLSEGPCASRFLALRERLYAEKKSQRCVRLLTGLATAVLLLGVGYHFGRETRIGAFDTYDRLAQERPGEAGVCERLAYYEANIERCHSDRFWGVAERRKTADQRAEADRLVLPRILAEQAFTAWAEADERHDKAGQQPRRHAAAKAYLRAHGASAQPERLAVVTRVVEQTQKAFEADQAEWLGLAGRPTVRPDDYAQKIRDLKKYADRPDALMVTEARALVEATRLDWDRLEYTDLLALSRTCTEPDSFDHLESVAKDYVRRDRHGCTMAAPVNDLIRRIGELRGPKSYSVLIKQVQIPAGSDLHAEFTGHPNCSVKVALGGQAYETKKVKPPKKDSDGGFTIDVNQRLGPYQVAWGEQTATVTVITNRSVFPNDVASSTLTHDKLVMTRFNAPVPVTCRLGKTVTVLADCPEARLPTLPAFAR
jgi:hypothetical protein